MPRCGVRTRKADPRHTIVRQVPREILQARLVLEVGVRGVRSSRVVHVHRLARGQHRERHQLARVVGSRVELHVGVVLPVTDATGPFGAVAHLNRDRWRKRSATARADRHGALRGHHLRQLPFGRALEDLQGATLRHHGGNHRVGLIDPALMAMRDGPYGVVHGGRKQRGVRVHGVRGAHHADGRLVQSGLRDAVHERVEVEDVHGVRLRVVQQQLALRDGHAPFGGLELQVRRGALALGGAVPHGERRRGVAVVRHAPALREEHVLGRGRGGGQGVAARLQVGKAGDGGGAIGSEISADQRRVLNQTVRCRHGRFVMIDRLRRRALEIVVLREARHAHVGHGAVLVRRGLGHSVRLDEGSVLREMIDGRVRVVTDEKEHVVGVVGRVQHVRPIAQQLFAHVVTEIVTVVA